MRMVITAVLLAVIAAVSALVFLAKSRGRDSRYFHLLSSIAAPVTTLFDGRSSQDPIRIPWEAELGAELGPPWQWFQRELVDVIADGESLALVPVAESVWWMNQRGPMVYRTLEGDGTIVLEVRTRMRSDPAVPPDMEWQFAGIMLRDPRSDAPMTRENYVFNVVGHRGHGLQVETKSTRAGMSQVDAWDWQSGDAQLMIERRGSQFTMKARPDEAQEWEVLITYDRDDLPKRLQLGMIVYAFSEGRGRFDMQAYFDRLAVSR